VAKGREEEEESDSAAGKTSAHGDTTTATTYLVRYAKNVAVGALAWKKGARLEHHGMTYMARLCKATQCILSKCESGGRGLAPADIS